METYKIVDEGEIALKKGKFVSEVFSQHQRSYGDKSAIKIENTACNILYNTMNNNDINKSKNVLLVGKVQSGKTSNLEMLSALSFDNDFNLLIIYGGYDNSLLDQTIQRFKQTFNIGENEYESDRPVMLTTESLEYIDDDYVSEIISMNRPIIITVLKRPVTLNKVNALLKKIDTENIKCFIIDDEGDQASLNTEKDKENNSSQTYLSITTMISLLNNPIYYTVTATPQANIFQSKYSELLPTEVHLIRPGDGYTGADFFHLNEDKVHVVPDTDKECLELGYLSDSLKEAIFYYIISSALLLQSNVRFTEMIIHSDRMKKGHENFFQICNNFIENIKLDFNNGNEKQVKIFYNTLRLLFSTSLFENVNNKYVWSEHLEKDIKNVVFALKFFIQNSDNKKNAESLKFCKYKIIIGGDLLQRGITFKHLITTYFTRWANKGTQDTVLQRARWFGYRGKVAEFCKIFTQNIIKFELANLATIENDLWDQFTLVENGQLSLNDVIINAGESMLTPARSNVIEINKKVFNKKWYNQKQGVFNLHQIKDNNDSINKFIANNTFVDSTLGSKISKVTNKISKIITRDFISLMEENKNIFDSHPFSITDIAKNISSEYVNVHLMFLAEDDYRNRSFSDEGKVSALQQGADKVDENTRTYLGDSSVLSDLDVPAIQVFKIKSKRHNEEYIQYMFSIHFSSKNTTFSRRD
ncbi:MAG: Z1 domain-containing protein [bacterium]